MADRVVSACVFRPASPTRPSSPRKAPTPLSIVDLSKMQTVATLPIGGKPAGVAVSRDGARAFVTSPEGKFLTVIDAATRTIEKRIPVEGGPLGVAVSPDGKRVYVADLYGRRLVEIDPAGGAQRSVGVGAMASGVAVDAGRQDDHRRRPRRQCALPHRRGDVSRALRPYRSASIPSA